MQAKRNKIAPIGIFSLLFVSRLVVSMTVMQSVYTGTVGSGFVISIIGALLMVLVISLPSIYCIKCKKNPFSLKWVSMLYGIYFILMTGMSVSRFSYFASTTLNPESMAWVYTLMALICALYGAMLGIEGLSRFSSVALILIVIGIVAVLLCNHANVDEVNLYPVMSEDRSNIVKNMIVSTSSTIEPALFLCLSRKVNGVAIKQYVMSILAVFTTILSLFYFASLVMGDFLKTQQFPLYSLFEQANVGGFERIDVIHVSFWILGIFIKSTLLVYCASVCFGNISQKVGSIICGAASFVVAMLISWLSEYTSVIYNASVVLFVIFCAAIPLIMLIFGKRNYGDELVQIL